MLERFQNLSTSWRVTIFIVGTIILVFGFIFASTQGEKAPAEDPGNGLGVIDPTPTTPNTDNPTPTEPPTETPTETPTEEPTPTPDYPIDAYGNLNTVPVSDPTMPTEEFDQLNIIVIDGVSNLYRVLSGESEEDRATRLQQWIDLSSPRMNDVVEWSQLGGLGFETGGTISSVDFIGGDENDTRFNIGLTISSSNPGTNENGNVAITQEYNIYQVALHKVDGVWKIWAVEETN